MEIPKTLWLKNNMDPDLFSRCQFFDLPDFLTYKATGETTRSACSLTCKCSYVPDKGEDHPAGWQDSFFTQIGLPEFVENNYAQIGPVENGLKAGRKKTTTLTAGIPVGKGLSKKSAEELGLLEGTPVGSAVIDACVSFLFYLSIHLYLSFYLSFYLSIWVLFYVNDTKFSQLCRVGWNDCGERNPGCSCCYFGEFE